MFRSILTIALAIFAVEAQAQSLVVTDAIRHFGVVTSYCGSTGPQWPIFERYIEQYRGYELELEQGSRYQRGVEFSPSSPHRISVYDMGNGRMMCGSFAESSDIASYLRGFTRDLGQPLHRRMENGQRWTWRVSSSSIYGRSGWRGVELEHVNISGKDVVVIFYFNY